jgi:hypothetical protein
VKQVKFVASRSVKTPNLAKIISEITPLETESKPTVSNRISSLPHKEQIGAEQGTIIARESQIIVEVQRDYQIEKTNDKMAEESIPGPSEKFAAETKIILPVSSMPEIVDEVKNVSSKPKIRDFAITNREHLINELFSESNQELKRWTGRELSYPQEQGLKALYKIQAENKPTFDQVMELNVLQKDFKEILPQPMTFFEANVLKLDNTNEPEKSEVLRRQIEYVDKTIELKETQKRESEISTSPAGETKNRAQFDAADYFNQSPESMERGGFVSPLAASSQYDEVRIADQLQEQIKQSLHEQGVSLKPLAQNLINTTINSWAKQLPTAEEKQKIVEIFKNGGDNLKPKNRLEVVSLIFARADEKERDEISFVLASTARANAEIALNKEINCQEVNLIPPPVVARSATNTKLSMPPGDINSGNETNKNQIDEYRQHLVNEIIRISRESAARQSIEVSPQAWRVLKDDFTNGDVASRKASESQKQDLTSLQKAIPKEERIDVDGASRIEAVHLILKFSPVDHRDELIKETLVNYEKTNEVTERQNFVAPAVEKSPIIKPLETFPAQNKSEYGVKVIQMKAGNLPHTDNNNITESVKLPIAEHNSAGNTASETQQPEKIKVPHIISQLPTTPNQIEREGISEAEQKFNARRND